MVVTVLVLIRGHVSFVFFVSQVDATICLSLSLAPPSPPFLAPRFPELWRLTCCVLTLAKVVCVYWMGMYGSYFSHREQSERKHFLYLSRGQNV